MKRFIPIHPNISCALTHQELSFMIMLLDQEFIRETGYTDGWSQNYYITSLGVGKRVFKKIIERLDKMGLFDSVIMRGYSASKYTVNKASWERLLEVLDSTNNREKLIEFCKETFVSQQRSVSSITEEEITKLKRTIRFAKKNAGKVKSEEAPKKEVVSFAPTLQNDTTGMCQNDKTGKCQNESSLSYQNVRLNNQNQNENNMNVSEDGLMRILDILDKSQNNYHEFALKQLDAQKNTNLQGGVICTHPHSEHTGDGNTWCQMKPPVKIMECDGNLEMLYSELTRELEEVPSEVLNEVMSLNLEPLLNEIREKVGSFDTTKVGAFGTLVYNMYSIYNIIYNKLYTYTSSSNISFNNYRVLITVLVRELLHNRNNEVVSRKINRGSRGKEENEIQIPSLEKVQEGVDFQFQKEPFNSQVSLPNSKVGANKNIDSSQSGWGDISVELPEDILKAFEVEQQQMTSDFEKSWKEYQVNKQKELDEEDDSNSQLDEETEVDDTLSLENNKESDARTTTIEDKTDEDAEISSSETFSPSPSVIVHPEDKSAEIEPNNEPIKHRRLRLDEEEDLPAPSISDEEEETPPAPINPERTIRPMGKHPRLRPDYQEKDEEHEDEEPENKVPDLSQNGLVEINGVSVPLPYGRDKDGDMIFRQHTNKPYYVPKEDIVQVQRMMRDFVQEYPEEGYEVSNDAINELWDDLKQDYSADEDMDALTLEDLFPFLIRHRSRTIIHYHYFHEKTEEEYEAEFLAIPVMHKYTEQELKMDEYEKTRIIQHEFRDMFPLNTPIPQSEMLQSLGQLMRDLELSRIFSFWWNNPKLLPQLFAEAQISKANPNDGSLLERVDSAEHYNGDDSLIQLIMPSVLKYQPTRVEDNNGNPFIDRLQTFVWPKIRKFDTGYADARDIIPRILTFLQYQPATQVPEYELIQVCDVIREKYQLGGTGFQPFDYLTLYFDLYDHEHNEPGRLYLKEFSYDPEQLTSDQIDNTPFSMPVNKTPKQEQEPEPESDPALIASERRRRVQFGADYSGESVQEPTGTAEEDEETPEEKRARRRARAEQLQQQEENGYSDHTIRHRLPDVAPEPEKEPEPELTEAEKRRLARRAGRTNVRYGS